MSDLLKSIGVETYHQNVMDLPENEVAKRYVSTAEVSAALGVSVTTIKRWVDDGILPAHRTAGGHRKLLYADVVRLARESPLPRADLGRLNHVQERSSVRDASSLVDDFVTAIRAGNAEDVQSITQAAYRSGLSVDVIADGVIAPALERIGTEWAAGRLDVMHEHRGTQLVIAAIYQLTTIISQNAAPARPVACGGAIAGDHYILPTLLAQASLLDHGWDAINLGPNTPMASFRHAIVEHRPRLVWISVSYLANPDEFEREYREFYHDAEKLGIAVAIGGRALPDQMRSRIPYTTYGDGLGHLVAFARSLSPRPRVPKRGRPSKKSTS